MIIKIEDVQNGWILSYEGTWADTDEPREIKEVFSYNDDNKLEALRDLLLRVNEEIGVVYSKHNERNLIIEIKDNKDV